MDKHIFISYAKKDTHNLAEKLAQEINSIDGLSAWMDHSLEPMDSWVGQIEIELKKSNFVVVLLSPDVNRHGTPSFVLNEIGFAQDQDKPIISVMAQKTHLPLRIANDQYIDITQNGLAGISKIVDFLCKKAGVDNKNVWVPVEIDLLDHTFVVLLIPPIDGKVLCMSKHLVTNAQYKKFTDETNHPEPIGEVFDKEKGWYGCFRP